jgi:UDP-N-acetylglucosamine:LPS N-acetylglucosamine transferase
MSKKILFISGSIGLGHVMRDLAITKELRWLNPGIDISWLAAHPASQILKDAGEKLLSDSDHWVNYAPVVEKFAKDGKFNVIKWLYRSRDDWIQNVEVFKNVLNKYQFDLIVGDETYEISVAVKKNPGIKKIPYVVIYDFIGMVATSKSPVEILGTYIWNKKWVAKTKFDPFPIELTLFIGEPEDVPDRRFGLLMPHMRNFARERCEFVGYIINANLNDLKDRSKIRHKLGYGNEPLVICSIGGTAVGKELLGLCAQAYRIVKEKETDLRMVLVGGPRINPGELGPLRGIDIRGFIPDLIEHFAACDLAIVQAGGTTTLELTALNKPFLYFPLEQHCEQQVHVAGRLARHNAGIKLSFITATAESLAENIVSNIGKEVTYEPIPLDGARIAAEKIWRFL